MPGGGIYYVWVSLDFSVPSTYLFGCVQMPCTCSILLCTDALYLFYFAVFRCLVLVLFCRVQMPCTCSVLLCTDATAQVTLFSAGCAVFFCLVSITHGFSLFRYINVFFVFFSCVQMLAKLACGLHKPNKQTVLPHGCVDAIFSKLPLCKV